LTVSIQKEITKDVWGNTNTKLHDTLVMNKTKAGAEGSHFW